MLRPGNIIQVNFQKSTEDCVKGEIYRVAEPAAPASVREQRE
jgi:hypothetical protein